MKTIKAILLITIGTLFVNCQSDTTQDLSAPEAGTTVVTNPTYTKDIKPIFATSCISCHGTTGQEIPLETYIDVKDNSETGRILCYIDNPANCNKPASKIMPPTSNGGRMPQATIDLIKLWASQGYVE
jgi:hypothetical protein